MLVPSRLATLATSFFNDLGSRNGYDAVSLIS
jgi:hypothetical protein